MRKKTRKVALGEKKKIPQCVFSIFRVKFTELNAFDTIFILPNITFLI